MNRVRVIAVLMAATAAAFAADDDPVNAPYVEKGDCWSYRAENFPSHHGPIRDYDLCVNLVDRAKGTILAIATIKNDGREIDTAWSTEWATRASVSGVISQQGVRYFKFPLHVGDAHTTEYEFRIPRNGADFLGTARYDMKVAGWEDVTVPAGTFRALRVEGRGAGVVGDAKTEFTQSITLWYAPKISRHVKLRFQTGRNTTMSEELTSYRLNQ